jgi:hypothetical protein
MLQRIPKSDKRSTSFSFINNSYKNGIATNVLSNAREASEYRLSESKNALF